MFFKRHYLTIIIFCLLLLGLVSLLLLKPRQPPAAEQLTLSSRPPAPIERPPITVSRSSQTLSISSGASQPAEKFDTSLALTLLQEIALDEQGRLIINGQLKRQLDNAVNLIGNERSPAELDKLSQLIKQTFAQATAQTVDNVLHRYYSYKIAEQNYGSTLTATDAINTQKNAQTLLAMRESYLGHDLAEQLFGEEKIYNDYISELTGQLSAPDLTEEMRGNITTEMQKKYHQEGEIEDL